MTFETIQFYADSLMTTGAEMLAIVIEYTSNLAIFTRRGMTIDAFLQAILFSANTLVHGFVTFVLEQIHVRCANNIGRFNTFFPFRGRHNIAVGISIRAGVITGSVSAN